MTVNGRVPTLAIVVQVREVFFHCAKALRRSHIWDSTHHQDRTRMPSLIKIILDETTGAPGEEEIQKIGAGLEEDYKKTMYCKAPDPKIGSRLLIDLHREVSSTDRSRKSAVLHQRRYDSGGRVTQ
jgi:hypothetical protein